MLQPDLRVTYFRVEGPLSEKGLTQSPAFSPKICGALKSDNFVPVKMGRTPPFCDPFDLAEIRNLQSSHCVDPSVFRRLWFQAQVLIIVKIHSHCFFFRRSREVRPLPLEIFIQNVQMSRSITRL